ncbi:protein archease isoform X1 [Passer domesticus]|uniref:protein archease isoform X1 n=1 Tax=Passer domesticus TaxID=48849 RepID=UPI0030FE7AB2
MAGRGERGGGAERGGAGWARRAGGSCARCSDPSGRGSVYCFLPPLRAAPGAAHPFARQRRPISARRRGAPANRRRARGRGRERARRSRGRAPCVSRHFPERPQRALKGAAPRAEGRRVPVWCRFPVLPPGPRLGRTGVCGSCGHHRRGQSVSGRQRSVHCRVWPKRLNGESSPG